MFLETCNILKLVDSNFGFKKPIARGANKRFIEPVTTAAWISAGGAIGGGLLSGGSDRSMKKFSTLDRNQKGILYVLLGEDLGVDPSILAQDPKNIIRLLKSGSFDHLMDRATEANQDYINERVFTGDRVADLTTPEKDLITAGLAGDYRQVDVRSMLQGNRDRWGRSDLQFTASPEITAPEFTDINTNDLLNSSKVGSGVQIVGEDGPEVINPTEDINIIPTNSADAVLAALGSSRDSYASKLANTTGITAAKSALKNAKNSAKVADKISSINAKTDAFNASQSNEFNPLATESNTVGVDPEDLLGATGLPGLADGGALNEDQKAVVGENGPELAVPAGTLQNDINQASGRALSGTASSTINTGTTDRLIKDSIVDPLNRQYKESTLPTISASVAGSGFLGSQRVKATQRSAQTLSNQIGSQTAELRYKDETARRDLLESAADRSANSLSVSQDIANNDLLRSGKLADIDSTKAGTDSTRFKTSRGEELLPGEVSQQGADLRGTEADTSSTEFDTRRGEGLLPGEVLQQGADIAGTEADTASTTQDTRLAESTFDDDVEQSGLATTQAQSDIDLTDARFLETDANRNNINMATRLTEERGFGQGIQNVADEAAAVSAVITASIDSINALLEIAGIPRDLEQAEMDAAVLLQSEKNAVWGEKYARLWEKITEPMTGLR